MGKRQNGNNSKTYRNDINKNVFSGMEIKSELISLKLIRIKKIRIKYYFTIVFMYVCQKQILILIRKII